MANNENEDPDALPDFEADGDFAEFEEGRPQASLGDTIRNNPLIKLGLVAAALIIVVGGIVLFGGDKEKPVNSQVGQSNDLKETPGTKELTPAMQEAMEIYNDQQLTKAVNTGDSVLPTPITPPKTFLPAPDDTTTNEDPLQRWRQMQEERLRIQREQEQLAAQANQTGMNDPAVAAAIKDLAEAMSNNMVQIVSEKQPQPLHYMKIWAEQEGGQGEGSGNGQGGTYGVGQNGVGANGVAGTMAPPQPLDIVVAAGSIVYAQLLNEANSDVVGPIVALVAQGPFSGARVLGSFSRQEEYLVLQFNTLVTKDGYSVPIQSYALDPDTTLTGMATEVDHRYWKRIILPAAASFIQGIGEAIAESGTSVTVNNSSGTTTTQDSGSIDTKEELAKGVEKSFEKIGSMLDEEGNETEPLVIVKAGSPLGLLFMQSVTKQAVDAAKYGSGMMGAQGQQMPGQQQQQTNPLLSLINGMGQQQTNQFGQPVNQYGQPVNPLAQYGAQQQNAYPGLPPALLQALQQQQGLQNANQYAPQTPAQ